MKRIFISLLTLLVVFSTLLVGCKEQPPADDGNDGNDKKPPAAEATPFTKTEIICLPTSMHR